MAFYRVNCEECNHTFYRVEVRCTSYDEAYVCPVCGTSATTKVFVEPDDQQKTAEDNPCCGGNHGSCGCDH